MIILPLPCLPSLILSRPYPILLSSQALKFWAVLHVEEMCNDVMILDRCVIYTTWRCGSDPT